MRLLADYHLHTKYSRFFHGKNTIEEMVNTANALGLTEIAITDHGFKHWCRTSKTKLKKAREIIDEINSWSATKVLLGIEADIISEDGTIDVDNETLTMLDILIVGYHRMIKTDFAGYFGTTAKTKAAIAKCTNAYLNAIAKYPVTIVSHLDSILTTDLYKIGRACQEKGVMVEINNRHTRWTQKQVDELIASNCMFVVSSDAHSREQVGRVDNAFEIIKKYQIPSEYVVNVEFAYDEKSEDDRSYDAYMSIYAQKEAHDKKVEEEKAAKAEVEFTESLSNEMEEALKKIAEEKGINLNGDSVDRDSDEFYISSGATVEELELIRQAEEFIRQNKLKEFEAQNEKLADFDELIEDNEAEQIAEAETKNDNVDDVINELETEIKNNEDETKEVVETESVNELDSLVTDVVEESSQEETKQQTQEKNTEDKILSVMHGPKLKGSSTNKKASVKQEIVENKPKAAKKSFGGFMNDTAGFVDVAEKNETKKTKK